MVFVRILVRAWTNTARLVSAGASMSKGVSGAMQRSDVNAKIEANRPMTGVNTPASSAGASGGQGAADSADKIPLIRRSRHRDELEYDLLNVLLWASKNVPSDMFDQIYTLIWSFTRLDEQEREKALADIRSIGDARYGPGRDAKSPPPR